ncbi:MAG: hypothetical protein M1355_04420 [Patescibacteria group bacterium]|nr:hypothetical protein [Patescibacteria group bacterium]
MRESKNLSKRELEVLAALRGYLAHNNKLPSYRKLGDELGYKSSPQRVAYFISRLRDKGYISINKEGGININYDAAKEYLDNYGSIETVDVPMYEGSIPCGTAVDAEQQTKAVYKISTRIAPKGNNYYLLKAKGDSMDKAGINEGDILLIKSQPCPEDKDKVAALVDNEVTLKEFRRIDGLAMLVPKSTSPRHKPIIITENCSIQGVVVKVFPGDIFPK